MKKKFDGNPQTYYIISDWCREEEENESADKK